MIEGDRSRLPSNGIRGTNISFGSQRSDRDTRLAHQPAGVGIQ